MTATAAAAGLGLAKLYMRDRLDDGIAMATELDDAERADIAAALAPIVHAVLDHIGGDVDELATSGRVVGVVQLLCALMQLHYGCDRLPAPSSLTDDVVRAFDSLIAAYLTEGDR